MFFGIKSSAKICFSCIYKIEYCTVPKEMFQCVPMLLTRSARYCSDFRYESNGIFVLGMSFFFFRQIYLAIFNANFLISFKRYCCPELKFKKIFYL